MKLINDIINELIDTDKSISSPLLKTKVLASRLQNEILLKWVTNELKGYEDSDVLPDYRKFKGSIAGTYIVGYQKYNNQPVPLDGLDEKFQNSLTNMNFFESVSSLENLKRDDGRGKLEYVFPAEVTGYIEENWINMGNPYLRLINCKRWVSGNVILGILACVRNNLLDFMLKIDSEFGNITEIEELKTKKEEITTIMNQTIINNTGDGNVLNTGEKAKITAKINITKGSKDELSARLKEGGIKEEDIAELVEIIDEEEPDFVNQTFGGKVNTWTQKMLGKSLDGSWNIALAVAGNLITEVVKAYYGM
ncbi:AbiTii domain-containing protein [Flavobacterium mesophilum]|uniref:AbiTii domain-containing protein n=1 Tax=Flavobacterium mesophilum TaxID=3143495 RepID=UPI0031D09F39